jgi:hypothetical protein
MNKRIFLPFFLSAIFILAMCVYWLRLGFAFVPLRETLYLSTPALAVIGGLFALSRFGFRGSRSITLIFLTAGAAYLFFGEVLFDYYQYVLQINPFPSAADAFYLLSYPLFLLGFFNEVMASKVSWRKVPAKKIFAILGMAVVLIGIVGYFGVYKAYDSAETLFTNIIAMSYGVGDILLIFANLLVLLLAWEFRGGSLSRVWIILFLGFVVTLGGDVLYAIYTDQYESVVWFYKSLIDTFFMGGYLLFAYALFSFGASIMDAFKQVKNFQKGNMKGGSV